MYCIDLALLLEEYAIELLAPYIKAQEPNVTGELMSAYLVPPTGVRIDMGTESEKEEETGRDVAHDEEGGTKKRRRKMVYDSMELTGDLRYGNYNGERQIERIRIAQEQIGMALQKRCGKGDEMSGRG